MRFASLGSGSRGNATLVETDSACLLIDCGFSVTETTRRLQRLGRTPDDITAILVTHEHSDHIRGVGPLARRYRTPVWMTAGTAMMASDNELPQVEWFSCHEVFEIGDIRVEPFPVPHDAREPAQFVFSSGRQRLGLLTDVGCLTEHICRSLDGLDGFILETNHDEGMLERGPYPPALKRRVGGRQGHLSNRQAADLLTRIDTSRLQHLVAAHISEKNNHPDLAREAIVAALGDEPDWLALADQDGGFDWRVLD